MALDKVLENDIILSNRERRLIELLRTVNFGKVEVHIENNQPARIVRISENILLTGEVALRD